MSRVVTQAAFARSQGWSKSYVTALKQADRLVMTVDGKHVHLAKSVVRIKETSDPNRDDVQKRHAVGRKGKNGKNGGGEAVPAFPETPVKFSVARARKEFALADIAEADRDLKLGRLVDMEDVKQAAMDAGATMRAMLENIPDQLSPQLTAISDREEIHALLVEHVEHALKEVSHKLGGMGKAA